MLVWVIAMGIGAAVPWLLRRLGWSVPMADTRVQELVWLPIAVILAAISFAHQRRLAEQETDWD